MKGESGSLMNSEDLIMELVKGKKNYDDCKYYLVQIGVVDVAICGQKIRRYSSNFLIV